MITDKVGGSSAKPEVSKQSKEKRLKHKVSGYKSQSKRRSIAGCRLLLRTLNHLLLTSGFHGERQPAKQALFFGVFGRVKHEAGVKPHSAWSARHAPYPASRVSDALACFRSPEKRKKIEPVLQARWKYSKGTYVIMITASVKIRFFLLLTTVDCNWSSSAWIHMIFQHSNKISI